MDNANCLTGAQVRAARREYRGPTDKGWNLFNGGEPYGSELGWNVSAECTLALNYAKYLAFWKNPPKRFSCRDIRFSTAMHRRLQKLGGI